MNEHIIYWWFWVWNKQIQGQTCPAIQDGNNESKEPEQSHFTVWEHGWNGRDELVNVFNRLTPNTLQRQLQVEVWLAKGAKTRGRILINRNNADTQKPQQCSLLQRHCSDKYVHSSKEPCPDPQASSSHCMVPSQKIGQLSWLMTWWHGCCKWNNVDGHQHMLQ